MSQNMSKIPKIVSREKKELHKSNCVLGFLKYSHTSVIGLYVCFAMHAIRPEGPESRPLRLSRVLDQGIASPTIVREESQLRNILFIYYIIYIEYRIYIIFNILYNIFFFSSSCIFLF